MLRSAPASPAGVRRAATPSASVLLGSDHPLVRVLDALSVVGRQLRVAATILGASLIAVAADVIWAPALAAGAGLVSLVLAAVGAVLRQRRRALAVALIAAGRERLPLAAVACERRRLLGRRMRSSLAASLEGLVKEAVAPPRLPGPPLFDYELIRAVGPELWQVAGLLRAKSASARGAALVWYLIYEGATSPLYRGGVAELREELGRIRYLLCSDRPGTRHQA